MISRIQFSALCLLTASGSISAQPVQKADTPDALKARIEAMYPRKLVWKEITWKTCLLDGIQDARKRSKPILLWVFIHNPNEERC